MNISYNWLQDYIQFDESPQRIAEILTDLGLEIGGVTKTESIKGGLEGLVVGEVLTCEKHPNADKLKLTTINTGGETPLNIVCGAPNVAVGQKVIVATIGTKLYSGEESFKIKKSKIRGALSEGMLCGEDEIGLGSSHDGIVVLHNDVPAGKLAKEHFEVSVDYNLEVDITPNRADALSHAGVARDLAVYFEVHGIDNKLNLPPVIEVTELTNNQVEVEINEIESCPKYCGISISNVAVTDSPDWLQKKLKSIGLKPINNVVDVTNFVLMELGQSLHAFDQDTVGSKIVVSKSFSGKKLTLLDDTEIELTNEDLVISNGTTPLCLAGIMGGKNSGVTENTKNIFLEAAYFNPVDVRKSSKRHNTKSDSSYRFERGMDPNNTEVALKRAVDLIVSIAGGEVSSKLNVIQNKTFNDFEVKFRFSQCFKLLGSSISKERILSILKALEIKVENVTEDELKLFVPPYRVDVQRECDIVEEILRVHGYNNIPTPSKINSSIVYEDRLPSENLQKLLSNLLSDNGFNEILNNSLTKPENYIGLESFNPEDSIELLNPLSNDLAILRRTLIFGGLESVQRNQNRKSGDLKLYEFGNIYSKSEKGAYVEEKKISLILSGNTSEHHWKTGSKKSDFFTLKGYIDLLFNRIGAKGLKLKASNNELFSEGVSIFFKKKLIAEYGKVKPSVAKIVGVKKDVYYAECSWSSLLEIVRNTKVKYKELSKFQAVKRDLSLLLDNNVTYTQVERLALETERNLLKTVELFDVYEGDKLPENKKSYALSFQLESKDETLKEEQIESVMKKLIGAFESKLGAQLR